MLPPMPPEAIASVGLAMCWPQVRALCPFPAFVDPDLWSDGINLPSSAEAYGFSTNMEAGEILDSLGFLS